MSDLISRQAVLETIDSRIEQIKKNTNAMNKSYPHLSFAEGVHDGYCRLKCDLRILPSVSVSENPNKWIPVYERLPEERQSVLVWCPERRNIYCACLEKQQWWIFGAFMKVQDEVVAWMPLPHPWKGE